MVLSFLAGAGLFIAGAVVAGGATATVMSSKHKKEIAALQSKIDTLVAELEKANQERLRLQKELDRVLREKQQLLAGIARLADEKRSLEGRLIEVDAQITANSARWRRIVAFLLFRLKALDAELRALNGERQHIEGKMQVIDIDDLRARKNLEAAEVMIGRLDPQLSEVMATISEKESERNSMEDRLRNLCAS